MDAASVVFGVGGLRVSATVVTTWGLLLVLGLGFWLAPGACRS